MDPGIWGLRNQVGPDCCFAVLRLLMTGLLLRMSREDEALKKVFGDEWDDWARTVPYSLIPWILYINSWALIGAHVPIGVADLASVVESEDLMVLGIAF